MRTGHITILRITSKTGRVTRSMFIVEDGKKESALEKLANIAFLANEYFDAGLLVEVGHGQSAPMIEDTDDLQGYERTMEAFLKQQTNQTA